MSWVRIDDAAPDHPKLVGLDDEAFALWVRGLCYCARHATDGEIPVAALRRLTGAKKPAAVAMRLVRAGLWEERGVMDCIPSAFAVHDFLEYHPSADEARAKREARAAAGRIGGKRSGESRSNREANASVSASDMLNPVPSRPVPSPTPPEIPPSVGGASAPARPTTGALLDVGPAEAKRPRAKRRTAMENRPAAWAPNEGHYEQGAAEGLGRADVLAQVQRWTDHHVAKGTLIADFDASFRTWLGNVRRFGGGSGARASFGRGSTLQAPAAPGEHEWEGDRPEDRF